MTPYVAEFLGTLFFLSVIRTTSGNPIWIGAALSTAVFLTANLSGGNLNPAVSVMNFVLGNLSAMETVMYAVVQIAAGILVAKFIPVLMK